MNEERRKIIRSLVYPTIFVLMMWLVKICEITFKTDFSKYGLLPLKPIGLIGIFTSPFLHEGFSHLFGNSIPVFVLGGLLFYFYPQLAWRVLALIYLVTGLWVWVFARGNGVHIGASGIVNGLAAFLFMSGILRRDTKLMAITLLITFLYGGLIWGIFPQLFPQKNISWESHLMGLLAGIVIALYYRKSGPQREKYDWEDAEDKDDDNQQDMQDPPHPGTEPPGSISPSSEVIYHYKKDT
jgi:membrane associated rhomboid family serine protease